MNDASASINQVSYIKRSKNIPTFVYVDIMPQSILVRVPGSLSSRSRKLKVPKREIFVTELIILSHPIWIGDLRNEPKNRFV